MSPDCQGGDSSGNLVDWFRSIGVLREDGRTSMPVLDRCRECRRATGCGACPGCRSGDVCHNLPPCPRCGVVQNIAVERLVRHPIHVRLYGDAPEREVFDTANGMLFAQSIAALGIIEPILGLEPDDDDETGVRPGHVLVLSGWRRTLAARASGATTIPVRIADPTALPRRGDADLVIVSANLQRQKTIDEIRREIDVWKRALSQASVRRPKPWEVRSAVAKIMGITPRAVHQAEAIAAERRLELARRNTGDTSDSRSVEADAEGSQPGATDVEARMRADQQPGDLRGTDIVGALTKRGEPLLSATRDEVVHASLNRLSQMSSGTSLLDVVDARPLWPVETDEGLAGRQSLTWSGPRSTEGLAKRPNGDTTMSGSKSEDVGEILPSDRPMRVRNLAIYRGRPDDVAFLSAGVGLILAAPSWLEPMARPLQTPPHVPFDASWQQRLRRCLIAWRQIIQPGGRLILIVPASTPLHPGLPVLGGAIDELRQTGWAIGGTIVLDDPALRGPMYAAPHPDQVMLPSGPARLMLAAAPISDDALGTDEERWHAAWSRPLPGQAPRQVATVEEASLAHMWSYAGPGRRSRWLPEFESGLPYHVIRIFSRPDATVLLPELGGVNLVRGALRSGRRVVALAELPAQIDDVVGRIRADEDGPNGSAPADLSIATIRSDRREATRDD